jgi:N-acylneuraminate cytidylyltransferase/CMP-N,N'-diacetyllegionaminic acid synthase
MTGVYGLIPARGGSKGIHRKNLREVAGKTLLAYAIEAAQGSSALDDFAVSTEDREIAAVTRRMGCTVLERPRELAGDETPMKEVVSHVLGGFGEANLPEVIVLLQPTAPLRTAQHIDDCVNLLRTSHARSVVSVAAVPGHYHPSWQFVLDEAGELSRYEGGSLSDLATRRQDLLQTYWRNGAIYAFQSEGFLQQGSFFLQPCQAYVMPVDVSINIDTERDLKLLEDALKRRSDDEPSDSENGHSI